MKLEIKIPSPGESIEHVEIAQWLVSDGDIVSQDQTIAEMESEKATISLVAEKGGKIEILHKVNELVKVGDTACIIDTSFEDKSIKIEASVPKTEEKTAEESPKKESITVLNNEQQSIDAYQNVKISPVAKKLMEINNISTEDILNGLHRITKNDVEAVMNSNSKNTVREESTIKISPLRRKLSEKLVGVQQETAMLTTFNEVDMSSVMNLRNSHNKSFVEKYGVKLGFMSLFAKAAAIAIKDFPMINARISDDEIIVAKYADIGIAVQTPKGLMVPVIRDVNTKQLFELEIEIQNIATKARDNKISLDDLRGGTFTITNGGVFGSLFSTPIINPPQSAILGMHTIADRPVAIDGEVKIRPMMYVALSYDHRVIDGKDSVGFLKTVKQLIENPLLIATNKASEGEALLGL